MRTITPASELPRLPELGEISSVAQPINDIYNFGLVLKKLLSKHVIDQPALVHTVVCAFLADIIVCLMGPSSEAKTHSAETMATLLGFGEENTTPLTPEVHPDDITGYMMFDQASTKMVYQPGSFTKPGHYVAILDEINRTSDKLQIALLYILRHGKVVVGGETHYLGEDFTTIMTMNPPGDDGVRRLIKALRDRIDFVLNVPLLMGQSLEDVISYSCSARSQNVDNAFEDGHVQIQDPKSGRKFSFEIGEIPSIIRDARAIFRYILEDVVEEGRDNEVVHTARLITEEFRDTDFWKVHATASTGASLVKMATIWALVHDGRPPTSWHVWQVAGGDPEVAGGCLGLLEPRQGMTNNKRLMLIRKKISDLHHRLRNSGDISEVVEPPRPDGQFRIRGNKFLHLLGSDSE